MDEQAAGERRYRIFLSHSSKDKWIATQMRRLIEDAGRNHHVEVFLDERVIEGGDSFPESIRVALDQCHEMVVLMSQYSVDSQWVLVELGGAWTRNKRIVAIMDKVGPADLPDIIQQDKAIDLNDFTEYLTQLVARAKEFQS